jgi:hypothetical protein
MKGEEIEVKYELMIVLIYLLDESGHTALETLSTKF